MKSDKLAYKLAAKEKKWNAKSKFDDKMNNNLLNKNMTSFWKTWRAKFIKEKVSPVIDGLCKNKDIAQNFAAMLENMSKSNSALRHTQLQEEFKLKFSNNGYHHMLLGN